MKSSGSLIRWFVFQSCRHRDRKFTGGSSKCHLEFTVQRHSLSQRYCLSRPQTRTFSTSPMPDFSLGLAIVLLLVLGAEFVNGWTDAPNAIATVVSTRCLSPFQAVCMASMLNLAGVLSGTAVAETIGKDIIDPSAVDLLTVGGAMVGIILWSTLAVGGAFQPASRMLWLPA